MKCFFEELVGKYSRDQCSSSIQYYAQLQNHFPPLTFTYMVKLKVEFNYPTIASTIQLFNYSTIQVKVGEDLEE